MAIHRTPVSDRLDRLYTKSIRCPYCNTKIPQVVDKCANCGITKAQLISAEILKRNKKAKQVKLMSKVRPEEIPFWKMALTGMFGFLGLHAFASKRPIRGAIILSSFILFFVFTAIFPYAYGDVSIHPFRASFEDQGLIFPFDVFGMVAAVLWIWDWFAILLGNYKYPVVLKEEQSK